MAAASRAVEPVHKVESLTEDRLRGVHAVIGNQDQRRVRSQRTGDDGVPDAAHRGVQFSRAEWDTGSVQMRGVVVIAREESGNELV